MLPTNFHLYTYSIHYNKYFIHVYSPVVKQMSAADHTNWAHVRLANSSSLWSVGVNEWSLHHTSHCMYWLLELTDHRGHCEWAATSRLISTSLMDIASHYVKWLDIRRVLHCVCHNTQAENSVVSCHCSTNVSSLFMCVSARFILDQ